MTRHFGYCRAQVIGRKSSGASRAKFRSGGARFTQLVDLVLTAIDYLFGICEPRALSFFQIRHTSKLTFWLDFGSVRLGEFIM